MAGSACWEAVGCTGGAKPGYNKVNHFHTLVHPGPAGRTRPKGPAPPAEGWMRAGDADHTRGAVAFRGSAGPHAGTGPAAAGRSLDFPVTPLSQCYPILRNSVYTFCRICRGKVAVRHRDSADPAPRGAPASSPVPRPTAASLLTSVRAGDAGRGNGSCHPRNAAVTSSPSGSGASVCPAWSATPPIRCAGRADQRFPDVLEAAAGRSFRSRDPVSRTAVTTPWRGFSE